MAETLTLVASVGGTSTTPAITISNVAVGDRIYIAGHANGNVTFVDNNESGKDLTRQNGDAIYQPLTGECVGLWYMEVGGGDSTGTVTYNFTLGSSQRWGLCALHVKSPVSSSFAVNFTGGNSNGTSVSSGTAVAVSTPTTYCYHVCVYGADGASTNINGNPSGYTGNTGTATQAIRIAYMLKPASGDTGTGTFTTAAAAQYTAFSFAIYGTEPPPPANLSYAPLPCVDANPVFDSSNTTGQRDELKAGVIVYKRTDGYPGALGKYSGLLEVIESGTPQPTFPTRIAGRTPLTMAYVDTDANGPVHVWGSGESGAPFNNEDIPDVIFPRRDGTGWVAFTHVGNSGADARTSRIRWCSGYDFTSWTEGGVTIIAQGGAATWDEDIVAEPPGVWLPNGKLKLFYRGGTVWNTDAQIGMAEATWDGNVSSLPTLTKYASNPVIATSAQAWLSTGAAPGGTIAEPRAASTDGYRLNNWLGARVAANGYGHAYSDDGGQTWTISATALALPVSPQTSLGDAVFVNPDDTPQRPNGGHIVWIHPGADTGGPEGRYAAYIPYKRALADITRLGRFYYPTGTPYSSITATASGGGIQQYTAFILAFEFCKPTGDRSAELATLFQQGDSDTDDHCFIRIDASGNLALFWSTTTTATAGPPFDLSMTSSSPVDDGIPHKVAVVRVGSSEFRLLIERRGVWTVEDTDTTEDFGTFTSAVNIAIGNGHPSNAAYGNFPFRGTVSNAAFVSGTPPTTTLGDTVAAIEAALDSSRTAYSGGTNRWDIDDATDNGEVVPVETVDFLELPVASTDGSTGTSDHTASGPLFIPASTERGRLVWLDVEWKNASTSGIGALSSITFNGVAMTLAHSRNVTTSGVATYYMLSDSLPAAAGVYTWSVTVDGASGEVNAACSFKVGMSQRGPYDTGGADNTSTSITASLAAPAGGWIRDVLHNATGTDDATPHATQTELCDFATDTTNAGRIATSIRPAFVAASFDMSWSAITTAEQHILIATSWAPMTDPVFALQQPLVPASIPN